MFWNLVDQICYLTPPVIHLPSSEVNTTFLQPLKMQCKNLLILFLPPPSFASDHKLVWVRKGGQIKRLFIGCPFLFFPKGFFFFLTEKSQKQSSKPAVSYMSNWILYTWKANLLACYTLWVQHRKRCLPGFISPWNSTTEDIQIWCVTEQNCFWHQPPNVKYPCCFCAPDSQI